MRILAVATLLVLLLSGVPSAVAQDPTVQAVGTQPYGDVTVSEESYPVLSPGGSEIGTAKWRVVQGTGNCCESYLATTPTGRLLDFGGTYLLFSDDRGETWRQVETTVPYLTGEGAVSAAPGGDIVGVGWTPYTGDQLWAHQYEADEDQWYYAPIPVHTPFHDRPWIAVVPGPVESLQGSSEYAVLLDGYPTHKSIVASLDGLHYDRPTNQHLVLSDAGGAIEVAPTDALDWVQPHRRAEITPLGGGAALGPAWISSCGSGEQAVMDPDLVWRCRSTGLPEIALVADSRGLVHHVQAQEGDGEITYRISPDAGGSWATQTVQLPGDLVLYERHSLDLAAHGGLGLSALAVHALNTSSQTHQDLVLRFDTRTGQPRLLETALVGEGGFLFGSNVASTDPRFDFISVAILPDGRVATSFKDATYKDEAAVAIELVEPSLPPARGGGPDDRDGDAGDGGGDQAEGGDEPNRIAPMARYSINITGLTAEVDASSSWDPDGNVTGYAWDWGDGTTDTGVRANHTYAQAGTYDIALTVTDDDGQSARVNRTFEVGGDEPLEETAADGGSNGAPATGVPAVLILASVSALLVARRRRG